MVSASTISIQNINGETSEEQDINEQLLLNHEYEVLETAEGETAKVDESGKLIFFPFFPQRKYEFRTFAYKRVTYKVCLIFGGF